jgi:hypothetical protein
MLENLLLKLRRTTADSELVRAVASLRRDGGRSIVLGDSPLRPLYRDEITKLEAQGNESADWSRVKVVDGFDGRRIHYSSFHGDVILGRCTRQVPLASGFAIPAGIYDSTVANCVIGSDALIQDVKLLVGYAVADNAVLLDCGAITCDEYTTFGNGAELPLGIESGGREVAVYAEIDVDVAAQAARLRGRHQLQEAYRAAVSAYTSQVACKRGFIGRQATIRNTPTLRNTYVGPYAVIDGATLVTDSTLLSDAQQPVRVESGACVMSSLLQWGSCATSLAIVERSVLAEQSGVEQHGKIKDSFLGPNSHLAEGEVTASLVGPFVSMHHQALLISTLWPEGRGNVSYGANIGANHTSKAPDQECRPGEGAFIGLGVSFKFPVDLSQAPYTVVAGGVILLPQKIRFPFSLLNNPGGVYPQISPAFNEIIPAWLLTDNLFAIKRNECKFRTRNRARRAEFDFRIFRPCTIDLMSGACSRLLAVRSPRDVYTERDIDGLGKNYMLEASRKPAIEAYGFFIKYYALTSLVGAVQAALDRSDREVIDLLVTSSSSPDWEHARRILCDDLGIRNVSAALQQLPAMLEKIAGAVEASKAKDDERGVRIIDDYEEAHVSAADHPFVRQVKSETLQLIKIIEVMIDRL